MPDGWVTGFRMTFRTEAIQSIGGFDVTLAEYGAYEDLDAGLGVVRDHVALKATRARLFHYQYPGGRGAGRTRGATDVANRAYVVCKHSPVGSRARGLLRRYAYYRALLYGLGGLRSAYHRDSCRGALAAARHLAPLLPATGEALPGLYVELLRRAGAPPRLVS